MPQQAQPAQPQTSNASYPLTSVCLIGESKTGKSFSLNTLRCSRVVFVFDPQGCGAYQFPYHELAPGTLSLDGQTIFASSNDPSTNIILDYTQAFTTISATATTAQDGFEPMWRKFVSDANALNNLPSTVVCVDGLTGLSRLVLTAVCAINKRPKPFQEDWGMAIAKIVEIVQAFVAQRHVFILICHVQVDKDEYTGRIKEMPLIYGKRLPDEIPACFATVLRTGYKVNKYIWYTKPQPLFQTVGSSAFQNLPEVIEPDFHALLTNSAKAVSLRT